MLIWETNENYEGSDDFLLSSDTYLFKNSSFALSLAICSCLQLRNRVPESVQKKMASFDKLYEFDTRMQALIPVLKSTIEFYESNNIAQVGGNERTKEHQRLIFVLGGFF